MLAALLLECPRQEAHYPPPRPHCLCLPGLLLLGSQVMVVYTEEELSPARLVSTAELGAVPAGWWE